MDIQGGVNHYQVGAPTGAQQGQRRGNIVGLRDFGTSAYGDLTGCANLTTQCADD
jgi:hypothetical protein